MLKDDKIPHYLGWTDLFFLTVPDMLIEKAMRKVADKDAIGLFALDSGRVVKKPKAQNVPVTYFRSATMRMPTVLYAPDGRLPSPRNDTLQLDDVAYHEPPRMIFTSSPFSSPFCATSTVDVHSQQLPDIL